MEEELAHIKNLFKFWIFFLDFFSSWIEKQNSFSEKSEFQVLRPNSEQGQKLEG